MKKISLILSIVLFSNLFAASVGTEESYSNSSSFNQQKNIEKSKTRNFEKTKSSEKGIEKNKNKSLSKTKSIENTLAIENSFSLSKNYSSKLTTSIAETQLMPEIDYLINKVMNKLVENDKYFIQNLVLKRYQIPDGMTTIPIIADYDVLDNGAGLIGKQFKILIGWLTNEYRQKIVNYIAFYLKNYSLRIGGTAGLNNTFKCTPATAIAYQPELARRGLCDITVGANYFVLLSGDVQGRIEASFSGSLLTPIFLRIPKYYIFITFDPTRNIFEVSYKNRKIVYLTPDETLHFYGDLIFDENYLNNNIVVVNQKINADGLTLNQPNQHNKFDDYFKKLMKLYLEAFKSLRGGTYSVDEVKFLIRKYIYEKVYHKNDFVQQYINNPTDFWRPRKKDLLNYSLVHTSYSDIVFDKKDGIILNQKVFFTIEKSSVIDRRFNQLIKTQKNKTFTKTISKTIAVFEKENRQDLVRLTKALAIKFASSKDFGKKQNLITKASTSTDVLNNLLNLVK